MIKTERCDGKLSWRLIKKGGCAIFNSGGFVLPAILIGSTIGQISRGKEWLPMFVFTVGVSLVLWVAMIGAVSYREKKRGF